MPSKFSIGFDQMMLDNDFGTNYNYDHNILKYYKRFPTKQQG